MAAVTQLALTLIPFQVIQAPFQGRTAAGSTVRWRRASVGGATAAALRTGRRRGIIWTAAASMRGEKTRN